MKIKNLKFPAIRRGGFSLIELIFAIALLSVIILGVVNLQTSNLGLSNTLNNELKAHFWAEQTLSIVEVLGKSAISSEIGECTENCQKEIKLDGDYSLVGIDGGSDIEEPFERYVLIEPIDEGDAYQVRAIIEWEDSTGEHRRLDDENNEINAHVEAKRIVY